MHCVLTAWKTSDVIVGGNVDPGSQALTERGGSEPRDGRSVPGGGEPMGGVAVGGPDLELYPTNIDPGSAPKKP